MKGHATGGTEKKRTAPHRFEGAGLRYTLVNNALVLQRGWSHGG
jgi:hypothetical protein